MIKKLLAGLLVAGLLASFLMPAIPVLAAPGWLGTWAHRVKLTTDNTDIDGALANFPLLLYISASSGRNSDDLSFVFDELTLDANRKKIAVTTTDGTTECYAEIEEWDDANEEAWLWVKAPSIASDTDTGFYLYYDSAHADNDAYVGDPNSVPAENVWDGNYKLVTHLLDDPDVSHIRDSTTEDNDGTKAGANQPIVTTSGQISDAQSFDGDDDYVTVPDDPSMSWTTKVSAFAWVKSPDVTAVAQIIVAKYVSITPNREWMLAKNANDGKLIVHFGDPNDGTYEGAQITDAAHLVNDTWAFVGFTFDAGTVKIYVNGSEVDSSLSAGAIPASLFNGVADLTIGVSDVNLNDYTGIIDEVRISDTARSAAWIKASYDSETDDLLDWGSEETTPTVTTVVCSGFNTDWAIVNGIVTDDGGSVITQVGFDYGLTDAYEGGEVTKAVDDLVTGDIFWMKIPDLDAGSVYHYRAKAYNATGWGTGSDMVFSTEGSATLYEKLNTLGDVDGDDIYAGNWAYMQFTVGSVAHSLDFANIYVKRTGAPGDAVLSLKHAVANEPTGTDLDVMTLDADLFNVALNWVGFDFPLDYTLEATESYALVLRCPDGTDANYLEWRWDDTGSLAGARAGKSVDSGINWTVDADGADYLFENWGDPVFEVLGAQVFTGYKETGDWLVVFTYRNYFKPYYPTISCPANFYMRFLDDTTMIAQGSCPAYKYRPGSFYFSKALANGMEWGVTDLKVNLYGDFGANPETEYNIAAADWRGADLEFLDDWVIQQANIIGDDIGVALTTTVADKGEILNAFGRDMFILGIPYLDEVRDNLFEYVLHQAEYEESTYTGALQAGTDWEIKVGPTVATMLTNGGMLLSITGQETGMMIIVILMLILVAVLAMKGHFAIGVMLAFVPLLLGTWLGFISYIILGVIVGSLGLVMFVYKLWLARA